MKKKPVPEIVSNSEKKYRALFDNAPIGIAIIDRNRKIIETNKALEKIAGLTCCELKSGLHLKRKYLHPDGSDIKPFEFPSYLAITENIIVADVEIGIIDDHNPVIWTQVSASPLELEEKCALVITQDITERKNLEIKLKANVVAAARDITMRKKMEAELLKSKKMLEKLNQHLHEVRENERTQIALNLHDDLGQKLTALCLDIAWVKSRIGVQSPAVKNKIEEILQSINETINSLKELSSFLRPSILFDLGLVPAVTTQLKKFEEQSGIKCFFYYNSEEFKIDNEISLIIYRIIQESLTNIARHSGASALELSLKKLKNSIEMIIQDDGIGIDKKNIKSLTSMGLAGIRERVSSAHGEVSIRGEKGSGTTIKVKLPVKPK